MSYDVAVWEGERPATDEEALGLFKSLHERHVKGQSEPPTRGILDFIESLHERYPDLMNLDGDTIDASPWADGPHINDASGPFFYFAMTWPGARSEALPFVVETAKRHGLVCFDPQRVQVLT